MADTKEKKSQCIVSTRLNWQEKESFINISRKLDIPYCSITRQLIRYVLQGQLMWLDLFEKTNDCIVPLDKNQNVPLRTSLTPEMYTDFAQFVEQRGSTTGVVMRRLILLYITGRIEWQTIWST